MGRRRNNLETAVSKIKAADELDAVADGDKLNELIGEAIELLRKDPRVGGDE